MEIFDQADMRLLVEVLRLLRRWDQSDLAAAAGYSASTISRYESGKLRLKVPNVRRLTSAAGLPVEWTERSLLPVLSAARKILEQAPTGSPDQLPPEPLTVNGSFPLTELTEAVQSRLDETLRLFDARLVSFHDGRRRRQLPPAAADREIALAAWARLEPCAPEERRWLVERCAEFHTWALAELLGEESTRAAPRSADAALHLARLAVRVAQLLAGHPAWQSRVEGYARAFLANALRVAGNLAAAAAAWTHALRLWQAGADPAALLPAWRLLDLEASFRCVTRQFEAALDLLDRAAATAPPTAVDRILLNRAQALEQAGRIPEAVAALEAAAPQITAAGDRRLQWVLAFNLTVNLCHLRRFAEAEAQLHGLGQLAHDLGNHLDSIHVAWLTGRVAAGLGRRTEAQAALLAVREQWAACRDGLGAAMVSLELAMLYLEEDRTAEVCQLADAMAWIFGVQGLEREALAALRLFCDAAQEQHATLAQARQVLALLERSGRQRQLATS